MPNRIIKDTIRTSKTVNAMTDFQFRLWIYLITYVDDYGRGSADPELLKGFVFPRRKGVTESTIEKVLLDLANSGSILLYEVDGESYFCFPNWADHQRIQTKRSRFPAPSDGTIKKSTVGHGESPPESNPIQSESNPNTNPNPNPNPNTPDGEDAFDRFWSAYPKKVDKNGSRRAFRKVDAPVDTLLMALENHKHSAQWSKEDGQFIPNPTTWLNQRRWEQELPADRSVPKGASGELGSAEMEAIRRVLAQPNETGDDEWKLST